jgi:polysaccharide biosynthesis/export protein
MKYTIIALAAIVATIANPMASQAPAAISDKPSGPSRNFAQSAIKTPTLQERNPRYRLRKGDTFDLDFALSPEFNQTLAVQPDGYVTLKAVGSIFVEGQTVPELTEAVKAAYAKTLHNPIIEVSLKDFEKPYFIAAGEVSKPGKYDLRSDLTVTEAVAIAGGFNDKAKNSQVVLFRPAPGGGFEVKRLNVKKLLASRNLSEDLQLQPGDVLYIPQSTFSKIRPFLPTSSMGAYYNPATF